MIKHFFIQIYRLFYTYLHTFSIATYFRHLFFVDFDIQIYYTALDYLHTSFYDDTDKFSSILGIMQCRIGNPLL